MPLTAQIVYIRSSLCLSQGQLTKVCSARINWLKLLFFPLSAHGVKPYYLFLQDVAKKVTFGNTLCNFNYTQTRYIVHRFVDLYDKYYRDFVQGDCVQYRNSVLYSSCN